MGSQEVFLSCMGVLAIFNILVCGGDTWNINGLVGMLVVMIPIVVLTGIHILSSGMQSGASNKLFGISMLLAILVKIDLPIAQERTSTITGLTHKGAERYITNLGLGLGTDTIAQFPPGELGGIPFFIATAIVILAFVSGLMMMLEAG